MSMSNLIKEIERTDWEFTEADTQYLTHSIHRYSGKFIPQIAGKAIELLTQPQDTVLDSYMGSGTTLLEAMIRNRNTIGVDLNPLAVLISKVKITSICNTDIDEIRSELIPYVSYLSSGGQLSLWYQPFHDNHINTQIEKNKWRMEDTWNQKWYQADVLTQLIQIFSCIEIIKNDKAKAIALVAFSDILRKSSNASSKYPNVMYDKNVKKKPLPARAYLESLNSVIDAVESMTLATKDISVTNSIYLQNNLNLPLAVESVDAIITHPPYIAAIPYAEYGALSLTWLGYDCKELDSGLTGGKRHSSQVVHRFSEDYSKFFVESYRVLKSGRYMFVMIGNPVAHGVKIDLNAMTQEYAEQAGLHHLTTAVRHGQNRRGNKMGDEYLMFFMK